MRKCGFLVNEGAKLTQNERRELQAINKEVYGLTQEQIDSIKLPDPKTMAFHTTIAKITNSKSQMFMVEKIDALEQLESAISTKILKLKKANKHCGGGVEANDLLPLKRKALDNVHRLEEFFGKSIKATAQSPPTGHTE